MKKLYLLALPVILSVLMAGLISTQKNNAVNIQVATPITTPNGQVTFSGLSYQPLSGGCYNAQIIISINATKTLSVSLRSIYLVQAGNATLTDTVNYVQANNTITSVLVFPNVPVNLNIEFSNYCVLPSTAGLQFFIYYNNPPGVIIQRVL